MQLKNTRIFAKWINLSHFTASSVQSTETLF